jgi:hypothetical protein
VRKSGARGAAVRAGVIACANANLSLILFSLALRRFRKPEAFGYDFREFRRSLFELARFFAFHLSPYDFSGSDGL